jgi:hypothetical protein
MMTGFMDPISFQTGSPCPIGSDLTHKGLKDVLLVIGAEKILIE